MTSTVKAPLLKGVFTTPERASAIDSLFEELKNYAGENDYLLTFESIPMVYFMTKTRPYLSNPWPILYLPSEMQKAIGWAGTKRPLPPAVFAKVQIRGRTWPDGSGVADFEPVNETRRLLLSFLEEKGYHKVWENNAFEILLPAGLR
jgi:hypothetical protein